MARPRSSESVRGYFRHLFEKHPDWLWSRSNDVVLQRWKKDHPDEDLSDKVKEGMANIKSIMRREQRDAEAGGAAGKPGSRPDRTARTATLEQLEASIDAVLLMARKLDSEELGSVIKHLRHARNRVVLDLGEPGKD
jgi:hypothetical protein